MSVFDRLKSVTLDSFLADHPEVPTMMARHRAILPERISDPLLVLAAESAYNENAMAYVCSVGGQIGEKSIYPYRFLVQSQVMAAYSVEEGGFAERGFLDPHSNLRQFMLRTASRLLGKPAPEVGFAREAGYRMGSAYLWRSGCPDVPEPHAAMLGAHFASEYLAAKQEFPGIVDLFLRDQPELLDHLRMEKDGDFGFSAAAWLEGHPVVEMQHAKYAARAAEAATYGREDCSEFWESWRAGFEEFCKNDAKYFSDLAGACQTCRAAS